MGTEERAEEHVSTGSKHRGNGDRISPLKLWEEVGGLSGIKSRRGGDGERKR